MVIYRIKFIGMQTNKLYQQALAMLESLPILGSENREEEYLLNQAILPCKGYCRVCLANPMGENKPSIVEHNRV